MKLKFLNSTAQTIVLSCFLSLEFSHRPGMFCLMLLPSYIKSMLKSSRSLWYTESE